MCAHLPENSGRKVLRRLNFVVFSWLDADERARGGMVLSGLHGSHL